MTAAPISSNLHSVFPGDSEMAVLARNVDWAATPLGPIETWPRALRGAIRTAMESPFPTNLWCGDEKVLIYNDAYRPVLGAKHPHALGRPGREVWAEIWPEVSQMFAAIDRGESVYAEDGHFVMERAEGPPGDAWFTYSLSPIRDETGAIIGYLNPAAETTGRVLAERQIDAARADAERAERRLREVFAQAPAFLGVLHGPEHRFEFANDAYLHLVGNRPVVGRTVAEALPEVVEQGFIALLDQVYSTGTTFVGREVAVMLDYGTGAPPEERILDFVYQPMVDGAGRSTGIVVHGSDVTDAVLARREVERLLRVSEEARRHAEESERRYRFLSNAIPVQIWTATPDGQLDFASDRAVEYFGVSAEQLLGDGWGAFVHPDDVARTRERWVRALATGEPYDHEFRLRNGRTGEYRWHLVRATAQRDDDGKILAWFGSNTDIEERRQAEVELERLTHEATEANRAKSDFLAAMSHELRTPLNAIGGYAQLIELGVRGPVTEAQKVDLAKIQRSKDHLDALVSDVLNFAKAGSGRIDFRLQRLGVARTLDAVLEMITPQAGEKAIHLEWPHVDPSLAMHADEDRARQILLNLFANALKFTETGGTIAVTVMEDDAAVAIAVRDTGIGIPAESLERIFEPFVQAERALRSTDRGVGLGLAISRQLARAMGGDLQVSSRVGVGSVFTLTLPRSSAA